MDRTVGKIYITNDYDKFKKIEANRDVKSVKKLLESIDAIGQVMSPILVNEKFEVIDGQHRLEAFRELGLPAYYMIQAGLGVEECQHLNIGQTNWTTMDYIISYAEQGNEDYQRFLRLMAEFSKDYKLEGVLAFATEIYPTGGGGHTIIKKKLLKLSQEDYELARTRLISAKELGFVDMQVENKPFCRTWYNAIAYAYRHEEIKIKRLAKCLKDNPVALASYYKLVDQLALFDKLYNKGQKNKVFMASDFQLGKYRRLK